MAGPGRGSLKTKWHLTIIPKALQERYVFLKEQCDNKLLGGGFKLVEFLACSLFLISFEVSGMSLARCVRYTQVIFTGPREW